MIVDKSGLQEEKNRDDINILALPAMERMFSAFGDSTASNLFLLGAYIAAVKALPGGLVIEKMNERFASREKLLSRNKKAFEPSMP